MLLVYVVGFPIGALFAVRHMAMMKKIANNNRANAARTWLFAKIIDLGNVQCFLFKPNVVLEGTVASERLVLQ